ncbi:hypothetical protein Tco_1004263 [Tanacetum coccineum]|uniref:DM2 domain-containing protein n=1 Tax=Tanacetum coccineum TaxID=301880 RepID=A0ABQ5FBL7_9ASTR
MSKLATVEGCFSSCGLRSVSHQANDLAEKIVDKLTWYVEDGDTVVDFCCGANDFSCLMKKRLADMGKKRCTYKKFDITRPNVHFLLCSYRVQIMQKSQENSQNRTITNTGMEKSAQEPGECYQRTLCQLPLQKECYHKSQSEHFNETISQVNSSVLRVGAFGIPAKATIKECHQCKTLCTLKDVRLLYATRLCIPDVIVMAHHIVADQKADAMGRADALRSLADALGRWADEYPRKADTYGRRTEASVQQVEKFDASMTML